MFIKPMHDLMGTLPFSVSTVAPPMARVKAKPRRKCVVVRRLRPLLSVIVASSLATS